MFTCKFSSIVCKIGSKTYNICGWISTTMNFVWIFIIFTKYFLTHAKLKGNVPPVATKFYKKIVVANDMVTYPIHLIRPIDPFICLSDIFFWFIHLINKIHLSNWSIKYVYSFYSSNTSIHHPDWPVQLKHVENSNYTANFVSSN